MLMSSDQLNRNWETHDVVFPKVSIGWFHGKQHLGNVVERRHGKRLCKPIVVDRHGIVVTECVTENVSDQRM